MQICTTEEFVKIRFLKGIVLQVHSHIKKIYVPDRNLYYRFGEPDSKGRGFFSGLDSPKEVFLFSV